jgi:GNAT superfamily N-acetyltransferase
MPPSPPPFDDAIHARPFEASDEGPVLDVLQAGFGRWPGEIHGVTPGEFFRWKHVASPRGPSILLVAEADDAVIGFGAYMPWQLKARGRILETMRGVDFVVHPSYRRRGVSMAIRAAANFPENIAFMWSNPNDISRLGGIKWGQREISGLGHFLQPCGSPRRTIRRAYGKGSKTPEPLPVEAETAGQIFRDGARAQLLLANTNVPHDRLATVKDLDYLRWRYGQFEEYRAIQADAGPDAGGVVIFRPRRHGRFWVAEVYELFVKPSDSGSARRLFQQVRDATQVEFISCSFATRRDATRCGFVLPSRHRSVVMTYPLQENLVPDPTRSDSWALSRGDLELL